jgi:hypothetical protein
MPFSGDLKYFLSLTKTCYVFVKGKRIDSDVDVVNCPHQKFVDKHVCFDCRSTSDALSFSLEVKIFDFVYLFVISLFLAAQLSNIYFIFDLHKGFPTLGNHAI